jgi:hypothetical protein
VRERHLRRIADATQGQTFAVVTANKTDEIVGSATGRLVGSVGYGVFEYLIDLREDTILTGLALNTTVPDNTGITWQFQFSEDKGYVWGPWSETFNYDQVVEFNKKTSRFVRVRVVFTSGLSEDDTESGEETATATPSLNSIQIVFNRVATSYIYLKPETLAAHIDEAVVVVNADVPTNDTVHVGISTSGHTTWDRFQNVTKPALLECGKAVLPYRTFGTTDGVVKEPLDSRDGFLFTARYGRWEPNSEVVVYDGYGEIVPASEYRLLADSGAVAFRSKRTGTFYITVTDADQVRVGIKVTSKTSTDQVKVQSAGIMYSLR